MDYRTVDIIDPPIVEFKDKVADTCSTSGILNLSQAVPSYPMPEKMKQALIEQFSDDVSFYTPDQGLLQLRQEICNLHNVNGVNVDPSQVLISAGANQGAFNVFTTLFKPGDRVALPVPYYFNYDMALKMLGIQPVYYFLDEKNHFKFEFTNFDKNILNVCKGIIVINPNNPTGAEYDTDELISLYNECNKKGVMLISDESYGFFSKIGYPAGSLLNNINSLDNLVIINTFSKTFSLTGFRVAYTIASKNIIHEIMKVQDTVIICAPRIAQMAALIGLRTCSEWLNEKVTLIKNNVDEFVKAFKAAKTKYELVSCGNFFAYVKHPYHDRTSEQVAMMLAKDHSLLTLPGSIFGPRQESFIRLAFGNLQGKDQILQLVEKLNG